MSELYGKGNDILRVYDDKYIEATLTNFSFSIIGRTGMSRGNISANFRADNIPFWQSDISVNTTQNISSGDTIYFVNSGNAKTPIKFTIINGAVSSATLIKFTQNNSLNWIYSGGLQNSGTLIVDSRSFAVTNEGIKYIGNFDGSFLSLDIGSNSLSYVGNTVETQVEYNPYWVNY
jgi:phage-related protein